MYIKTEGRTAMRVFGLVGSSGTGKSYQSIGLAMEMGISYIIDDGLLIKGTRILAGTSAKKEATKIAAIRRAVFMDPDHAKQVKEAIREESPESLLILGTSISMIERIIQHLELPCAEKIIHIEDITSHEDIELARKQRREEGKHIIPVPTFEVRKDFSGFFIDPLRIFRVWGKGRHLQTLEKTVVRPTYSYFGKFFISDSAIESIAAYNAQNISGVSRVLRSEVQSREDGIVIELEISLVYGNPIHKVMEEIQENVVEQIGYTTGLNINAVNVTARRLVYFPADKN
jgi:uncharacterized alkaline shock family protein YloU/adenylate kinase family enzyme